MDKLNNIKRGLFVLIMCLSISLCGCGSDGKSEKTETSPAEAQQSENISDEEITADSEKTDNTTAAEDQTKPEETTAAEAATTSKPKTTTAEASTTKEATTESETAAPEEKTESTYSSNEYFDVGETSSYLNFIGDTTVVHKVLAKKNVAVSATLLAYASDGSVIGKSSDDITLTEGKYNFFCFYFDGDISGASIKANAQPREDSYMTGERNAVEMVQYNRSGDDLYITFEQTGDELDPLASYKLLFYKGNQIIDTEEGYFCVSAENLNGKGSTDVASIWVYGIDFDRIEYVFEP